MIWQFGDRSLDFGERMQIMGILNVTPDSFYDGGRHCDLPAAVERGLQMVEEGADIIDIGGESSRPPVYGEVHEVEEEEECERVVPVVAELRRQSDVPISVDTVKAEVARRALDAGADIVNDISALTADSEMMGVAVERAASVILMHRRGSPTTMQRNTQYADLLGEVRDYLAGKAGEAQNAGIAPERIAIDPGIGFGKSIEGNLELINHLELFAELGYPILVGASRKSFIWKTLGLGQEEGLEGILAVAVVCVLKGIHMLRVHDVEATVRAVRMAEAVAHAG